MVAVFLCVRACVLTDSGGGRGRASEAGGPGQVGLAGDGPGQVGSDGGGPGVALRLQDRVQVDVVLGVSVTQEELQHIAVVTVEGGDQRAAAAQLPEAGGGRGAPGALQGAPTITSY